MQNGENFSKLRKYCRNVAIFQVEKIANYGDFFSFPAQFSLSLCVSVKREKCPIRHGKIHHYKCTLRIYQEKKSCNKKISSRVKFRRRGDATTCLLVRIFSKVVTSEWHVWYVRILYFLDMEKMSYFGEWWQNLREPKMDSLY